MKRPWAGAGLSLRVFLLALCAAGLGACRSGTPSYLLKTQKLDLDKASASEGLLQERADNLRRTVENAEQ